MNGYFCIFNDFWVIFLYSFCRSCCFDFFWQFWSFWFVFLIVFDYMVWAFLWPCSCVYFMLLSNHKSIHIINAKNSLCVCVCIIKLLCHFLPDLAQILNKAMNSKGAASKLVPVADFIQLLILLRNYFYALLLERHMIDKCSCEATRYK